MRLLQVHLQNIRFLERLSDGLSEKAVLAQVDVQQFHTLLGCVQQAVQRQARSGPPLRQCSETKAVGRGGQFQQFAGDVNKIISHLRDDGEIGVSLVVQAHFDGAGGMMIVLLEV